MRRTIKSIIAVCALVAAAWTPAQSRDLTVVELFTSQGCSSCPPADAFLGELAKRDDVLALSFHVDYWDYIGWKDTYASPANTERQRQYARRFGLGYVYTPQMVVQGTAQTTGSDRPSVLNSIAQAKTQPHVPVEIRREGDNVSVVLPASDNDPEAAILSVLFDRSNPTDIRRGENSGRKISYSNVVRKMKVIGAWRGDAMTVPLPVSEIDSEGRDACAIIVQSLRTGMILGAAVLDLDGA
jgi:hypothetical protein